MVRSIITLSILFLLAGQVDGQVVTLNRLQRAGGLGYIPYTDGTGKQGYTLLSSLLSDYLTGTGTAGRIAAWGTSDTLTSYIWEITNTYIRGSGTGWPQMENGFFTFRGDTDTGLKRIGANSVGLFAGGATNYRLRAASGVVDIDTDANGIPEWDFQAGTFGGSTAGNPRLYLSGTSNPQYTFSGDEDTGLRRSAANVLGLHAGDAANPVINMNATNITFDPDQDGTNDVTISATTLSTELLDVGAYGTTATKIAGLNASGVLTELIVGTRLSISGDSLIAESGLSGTGSANAVATWSSASALTFTDWLILSNVLQGPTLGDPAMSITDDAYSFTGDSNTGLKWSAADIAGLHAGDATNPMIKCDGTVDVITFDPDDDGTPDVSISDARTEFDNEVRIDAPSTDNTTHIAGMDAEEDVTKVAAFSDDFQYSTGASVDTLKLLPSFGQLAHNGSFEITNTSSDTLDPDFSWTELESGVIAADDATHSVTTNFAGYAEITFNVNMYNETGSDYTGNITFELYKNGSYLAPFSISVKRIANNESKDIHFSGMALTANGDDYHIRVYLSTAGTIDITNPIFNIKKL